MIPASFSTALPMLGSISVPAGRPLTPVSEIAIAYKRTLAVSSHVGLTMNRQLSWVAVEPSTIPEIDCRAMKLILSPTSDSSQKLPLD